MVRCAARLGPWLVRSLVEPKESDPCCKCELCRLQPTGGGQYGNWKKHRMVDHLGEWQRRGDVLHIQPAKHITQEDEWAFSDP